MGKTSLRNKSLKVNSRKTLAIALTVVLAMATLGALLAPLMGVARAQGQVILSSSNLNPYKVIELDIRLPGVEVDDVTLRLYDAAGNMITDFKAYKLATGRYIAYLGGHNAPDPANPKIDITTKSDAIYKLVTAKVDPTKTTTLTLEVLGYDVKVDIPFKPVAASLTVDRTTIPVRSDLQEKYKVTLTIGDQDLNFDPTKTDEIKLENLDRVYLSVKLVKKGTTGETFGGVVNLTTAAKTESVSFTPNNATYSEVFQYSNNLTREDYENEYEGVYYTYNYTASVTKKPVVPTKFNITSTSFVGGSMIRDNGTGGLYNTTTNEPLGKINYNTGAFWFLSNVTDTFTTSYWYVNSYTAKLSNTYIVNGTVTLSITVFSDQSVTLRDDGKGKLFKGTTEVGTINYATGDIVITNPSAIGWILSASASYRYFLSPAPFELKQNLYYRLAFKETTANSGALAITLSAKDILDLIEAADTSFTGTEKKFDAGDLLVVEAASNIVVDATKWGNDYVLSDSKTLDAVYTYPKVSIDFTNQVVTITVESPDDNVDLGTKDYLNGEVKIAYYIDTTKVYGVTITPDMKKFKETGANTGVFTYKLKVRWGGAEGIDTTKGIVYLKAGDREFTVKATYLDITASAKYTAVAPDVSIERATAKVVVLSVTDPDLNNDPNTLERLELTSIAIDGTMSFKKVKIKDEFYEPVLYTVKITDTKGNAIVPPSGYSPSFIETDVNSNTFKLMLPSQYSGTQLLKPGETYVITLTDSTGTYTKSVTVTVAEIKVELDRTTYPINIDGDVVVYVKLYDDRLNVDPTAIDTTDSGVLKCYVYNPTTGLYINPATGATSSAKTAEIEVDVPALKETGPNTGVFTASITVDHTKMSPAWIGAKIVVYKADEPDYKAEAKFDVYQIAPGDLSVDKTVVPLNGTLILTVYDPDANVDSAVKDEVSVDVYVDGVKKASLSLTETDVNSNKFECKVSVLKDIGYVKPGSTIKFEYSDRTPVRSPTALDFGEPVKVSVTVKVASFTGSLSVPKDWIGPYEIMTIRVVDQDLDTDPTVANTATVSVLIEGSAESKNLVLTETGMNTGVFEGKFSLGWWEKGDVKYIIDVKDIREKYMGKKVTITYVDEADENGNRKVNVATLAIKAVDAEISVDKEAVNLGQVLTITVKNLDIAQNPKAEFRQVLLRSTTYPTGITFYASEVEPGVYQVKVQVVSLDAWTPGAPQIPAKLGDTITIVYKDPIAADGTEKSFTKTVVVGVPVERPVPASEQKFLDVTGAEKEVGKVGETVMLSAKVQNVDVVDREFTAVFQVKDERGAVVYIAWITAKLAPGTSMTPAVSWTPTVAGTYTVEVLVVKSIAEPTPYSDKISAPFTVQ